MRRLLVTWAWVLWLLPGVAAVRAEPYKPDAGPHELATMTLEWRDQARQRDVPVRLYYPKPADGAAGPFPLVVVSHGLGGTRDGLSYVGRHWASHGYVCVHIQHVGSDASLLAATRPMQALRDALADPRHAINRPLDVSFVIDQVTTMNQSHPDFKGRVDLQRIGMAGHSFGAYTTLAVGGQVFVDRLGRRRTIADPRVKALLPMSAPPGKGPHDVAFGQLKLPCLHLTGTKDDSPITETTAADRRVPFDHMPGPDNYLVTFEGADHMVFGGRDRRGPGGTNDERIHALILQSTAAFWDAHLKGNADARRWLSEGGFEKELGRDGVFEQKQGKPRN